MCTLSVCACVCDACVYLCAVVCTCSMHTWVHICVYVCARANKCDYAHADGVCVIMRMQMACVHIYLGCLSAIIGVLPREVDLECGEAKRSRYQPSISCGLGSVVCFVLLCFCVGLRVKWRRPTEIIRGWGICGGQSNREGKAREVRSVAVH